MREIVLDTETTGLDPADGHRVIEIGCIEMANRIPTGATLHFYVQPERDIPEEAARIHGITAESLADKPVFAAVADELLEFLGDSPLVAHNAAFDLGFLNAELERAGRPPIPAARAVDTVAIARRKFPGAPASLDALCRRFGVDNSARTRHGALLDAELLADVYVELVGGRQAALALAPGAALAASAAAGGERKVWPARPHPPISAAELAAHEAFIDRLDDPIWRR